MSNGEQEMPERRRRQSNLEQRSARRMQQVMCDCQAVCAECFKHFVREVTVAKGARRSQHTPAADRKQCVESAVRGERRVESVACGFVLLSSVSALRLCPTRGGGAGVVDGKKGKRARLHLLCPVPEVQRAGTVICRCVEAIIRRASVVSPPWFAPTSGLPHSSPPSLFWMLFWSCWSC